MKINKKYVLIISLVLVISLVIGLSYAYYSFSVSLRDANIAGSDCFELTFSEGNAISISNGIPISDEDVNDLEPFHFTIKNICNSVMDYNINIETLSSGEDAIDLDAIASKVDLNSKQILGTLVNNSAVYNGNAVSSKTVYTGIITPNETKEHDVRLWIDESATVEQSANKNFSSKVIVTGTLKHNYVEGEKVLVTFDVNGGANLSYSERQYTVGSTYGELPTVARDGFTFLGWSTFGLPDEYQEVEYIKFNGSQYIDTNIIPSNHTTEIKFDFEDYNSAEHLFGTSRGALYYHFTPYRNRYYWGTNGTEYSDGSWTTGEHTLIYNGDNNAVILDDDLLSEGRNIASTTNLLIGDRGERNTLLQGKIYYIKITNKETNELERYMIPCYRKSDDVIGMYDLISKEFFENGGSGSFDKGSDSVLEKYNDIVNIVSSSTNILTNEDYTLYAIWGHNPTVTFDTNGGSVNNNQRTYAYNSMYTDTPIPIKNGYNFIGWGINGLPDEYQEVEYIKFTSGNYLNTNLKPINHTTEIKFDFDDYYNDEHLFGTSSGSLYYHFTSYSNKYYWGTNGTEYNNGSWTTGEHTLIYNGDNNAIRLDNVELGSGKNITSDQILTLGNRSGSINFQGKIYYAKITNKDTNEVERYLIPCYRKNDDIIGMYDIINKNFYINAGSGSFDKGSDGTFEKDFNVLNIVTSSTKMLTNEDHTLYAIWEEE